MPEWIGKTIGNVRIEKLLARGGMAEVYLGSHLNLERPVAVKVLHSYIEEEPLLIERFRREAKVVAGLRHPNIVQIFDFETIDGHPYIVMEYLKGPTLASYLRYLHQRKKRIPPDQVARLLNELSTALDYAHKQGVVHRDIKPGNVMLHSKTDDIPLDKPLTTDVEAVITDFGLVRIMNTASQTASGTVSGTPAYMSPEQARGDPTDHRTDIYSLGIVLYEMLAGRVPFEADSTLTVLHMQIHTTPPSIPGISAKVQAVIDRALVKNPADRYQTTRELTMDYSRAIGLTGEASTVPAPPPVTTLPVEEAAPPEPEPTTKAELVREPEPPAKSEPKIEQKPQKEPEIVVEQPRKQEPKAKPEPKPARSLAIPTLLLSVIGLVVLGAAAYFILSRINTAPQPTATLGPEIPNTGTSPSPTEAPSLPTADRMVKVDAGTYQVGKDPADDFHVAPTSITLQEFWIDQYQTTNEEYQKYLNETGASPPLVPLGGSKFPVIGVSFEQARAYCQSLNKRLPKEAEWEAAGRGGGENPRLYPWEDPNVALELPNELYEVGSFPGNISPFQVYDLVGNVWEWVDEPYESLPPGVNMLRGGRFSLPQDLAFRYAVSPDNPNIEYAGFRCAADQVQ